MENKKQNPSNFIKYSGIGMQMLGTICIMGWIGNWLDGYFSFSKQYMTILFLLLGTMGSIFSLIKQLK